MSSREGEEVIFTEEISTVENPKINEWLTLVEKQMRITLASYLANAVKDIKQFREGPINPEEFMMWCDKYQDQVVILAAQILWSEDVEEALVQINNSGDRNMKPLENVLNQVCVDRASQIIPCFFIVISRSEKGIKFLIFCM